MSRILLSVASAAFSSAILFSNISFAADQTPTVPDKTAPKDNSNSFNKPLADVHLNGSGLSDVIDFLADASGANMVVDWKALDAVKVAKDTPITLRLNGGITLRKALTLVLQQAGGAGVLTFYVDEGVVQITSQESEDKDLITRIYPIEDLLIEIPDYNNAPQISLTNNNSGGGGGGSNGGGGGGSSQGVFGGAGGGQCTTNTQTASTRQQRADEIIKMITDTVRPDVWKVNGGLSNISFVRGNLVVSAPRSVHDLLSSQYTTR